MNAPCEILHLRCQPGHVRGQRLFVHLQRNAPAEPRNAFQRLSKFSSIVQEISFCTGMSGFSRRRIQRLRTGIMSTISASSFARWSSCPSPAGSNRNTSRSIRPMRTSLGATLTSDAMLRRTSASASGHGR